ncbi:MAG TPA: M28 family peptidase [Terriglobales bacterium]|jgi:aminopeptidase YwaD|nr:M28 family peptidase [Terriglobales bacterium]
MPRKITLRLLSILLCLSVTPKVFTQAGPAASGSTTAPANSAAAVKVCTPCIRAHEEFLASDAMQGRGSGTHDELVAATYIASELRQYGIDPAGNNGGYIQSVPTIQRKITSVPQLKILPPPGAGEPIIWNYGKEFIVASLSQAEFSGPLWKLNTDKVSNVQTLKIEPGAVVLITGSDEKKETQAGFSVASEGGAAALMLTREKHLKRFDNASEHWPRLPDRLKEESAPDLVTDMNVNVLELNRDAFHVLMQMPEGTMLHFDASSSDKEGNTWNAVGILRGSDPSLRQAAILFSAHLDHLGIGTAVNGDNIYNGADDDASGTTAVLEIARVLGQERRPRRTVVFALFGSEEMGGLGSTYFRQHPPLLLKQIVANLEFEMIGRPDPAVKSDTLWLTGWERSNLGPALAAHGARLVRDPHPAEGFFARSDNYVLAKKGVVAHTISSYGLHDDYHQPSDDLAHLDLQHLNAAIGSLLASVEWLVNSSFRPKWNVGGQP